MLPPKKCTTPTLTDGSSIFGLCSQISKSFLKTGISNNLDGTQDDVLWEKQRKEMDSGGFVLTLTNINIGKKGGSTIQGD